jgi:hypothetical protein
MKIKCADCEPVDVEHSEEGLDFCSDCDVWKMKMTVEEQRKDIESLTNMLKDWKKKGLAK